MTRRLPALVPALMMSFALLGGCALSPQVVNIAPQASVSGPAYGQGRGATVEVISKLPSKTLGSRGGIYSETSTITINNDLSAAVKLTAEHALQQLGFSNTSSATPADITISIETLTYSSQVKKLIYHVDVETALKVTTVINGSVHEGNYRTEGAHQFTQAPNEEKNAKVINKLLSDTLDRAFSDPNLAKFMLQNP
jgi:uncharacterized lipoprotein